MASLSIKLNFSARKFYLYANLSDFLHHYTNINTLALILKNKKIRFNRLDRTDDLSEAKAFDKFNLAKYLFISCWTDSNEESIPQWHIYTDKMKGVRISLPKKFFHYRNLKPPIAWGATVEGELPSPISFDQIFGDRCYILPTFLRQEDFERKVKYVDTVSDYYKDAKEMQISKLIKCLIWLPINIRRGVFKTKSGLYFLLCHLCPYPIRGLEINNISKSSQATL